MDLALLIPIFGILLTMIPVAGITLALTLRHAVTPLVETLADALRESRGVDDAAVLARRVEALTAQVESLSTEVRQLRSAQDFDRQVLADPER